MSKASPARAFFEARAYGLFCQDPLQTVHLFAQRGGAPILVECFHSGHLGIQLVTLELPARDVQLFRQCHDILAASQSLHCKLAEFLRISSLCHLQFPFLQVCHNSLSHFGGSVQE